jgi:tetratricopeptide (TPR) repeat protein
MRARLATHLLTACIAAGVGAFVAMHISQRATPRLPSDGHHNPIPSSDPLDAEQLVAAADALCLADQYDLAKPLYQQAARDGNPDAHFALAYRYRCTREEGIHHFSQAAEQGHPQALKFAIEYLLFRADSLTHADPQRAMELYHAAKAANPSATWLNEKGDVRIMEMCCEAPAFDADAFIAQYGITEDELARPYAVWQLAEEASRGGRFGQPDPDLVFNLVIRGGSVPAELGGAVHDVHANWTRGVVEEFNIDNYVTSKYGLGFCAGRAKESARSVDTPK